MAATTSPIHRALRRVAAGGPEVSSRAVVSRVRSAAVRALGRVAWAIARPVRAAIEELLAGPIRTPAQPAAPPQPAQMAALIRRKSLSERASRAAIAHRRISTTIACALLIGAAAFSAMPAASASAEEPEQYPVAAASMAPDVDMTAGPGSQADPDDPAVDPDVPAGDDAEGPQAGAAQVDIGNALILNVIQAADVGAVGSGFKIYVVKTGDTLSKIGAQFGLSRATMYWANSARLTDPAALHIGQRLVIPPANGITVTVKEGDTVIGLGARYDVSAMAIQAANGLGDASLNAGQVVLIPVDAPAIPTPEASPCATCGFTWTGPRLRWPVPYSHTITQYFSRTHAALDIGANSGSHVIAAIGGKVIWTGWKDSGPGAGGGLQIWIYSDSKLWTTYNHLSHSYVRLGQTIRAGQHIGNVGQTGNATGPHLHFETWVCYPWSGGGTGCARDPLAFM